MVVLTGCVLLHLMAFIPCLIFSHDLTPTFYDPLHGLRRPTVVSLLECMVHMVIPGVILVNTFFFYFSVLCLSLSLPSHADPALSLNIASLQSSCF